MQPVPRILSGTQITQELLDAMVRAIHELQGHAITGVNYPLTRAGGTLSAMDNVNQAMVTVQNDTGGDLELGAVVGLDGPIEDDPTGALLAFQNAELTFSGIAPSETAGHTGKFAVLVDPIPTGATGRACIQGVVRVKVKIDDLDVADWADIDDGETGNLLAAESGSARILWYEDLEEPATVWAICLIGTGAGAEIQYGLVKEAPTSTASATIVVRPCDKDGTEDTSAGDVTLFVRRDRSSIDQVGFGWTTSTILTWLRFASDIGSAPAVSGVVIGGDEAGPGTPTVVCGPATPAFDDRQVAMDNFGRVAGWYEYDLCADTWTWNAGPWGYSDPSLRP